jgi:hypothetical protein
VWGRVFDPSVRAKLDDDHAFLQTQGISAEALPQATWGQPPSAARRSNAPLICVAHKEPVELRSTWTAEGGCPHVASDGSPPSGALAPTSTRRRYNSFVSAVSPPPDQPSPKRPSKLHIHKLEAGGILIIGALILLLTLTRYWHHIAWGVR